MFEIRWHSRAGQGAVTGAKGLADVISTTGKHVQAFAFYGSAKRGTAMTAYNRVDDNPIVNHEKFMNPDYVLVIDPALAFLSDITAHEKKSTKYIISTNLTKAELVKRQPKLEGKEVYVLDCTKISLETIGRNVPNAPMLGALINVSKILELNEFKQKMLKILTKFPQKIIDANMAAIEQAYEQVS